MAATSAPELAALLARYQQAWSDGDIEGILSMTPPDGVYEASFGPNPWGRRFVGHDEIRTALLDMGVGQPGHSRHLYGETHVVGDCGFALWTSVQDGPTDPRPPCTERTSTGSATEWSRPRSPTARTGSPEVSA